MPNYIPNAEPVPIIGVKPKTSWVTVTPQLATKWLDQSNTNNRAVRWPHVSALADDMKKGRWRGQNGEPIKFDTSGRMFEGQHRCYACIESDSPFETLLITDCDPEDYSTSGTGKSKVLADFLGPLHGEKNTALLSAAIRLVHAWSRNELKNAKSSAPSISDLEVTYKDHPNLSDSVNRVAGMSELRKILPQSYSALIHYAATLENKNARVESFLERLGDGLGLFDTDPVYHLRKFLLSQKGPSAGHRRSPKTFVLALVIKAWNFSKEEKKISALRLRADEEFPKL